MLHTGIILPNKSVFIVLISVCFVSDNSGSVLVGQQALIAGDVSQVTVGLRFRNLKEPAFQTFLTFSLPSIFVNPTITPKRVSLILLLC